MSQSRPAQIKAFCFRSTAGTRVHREGPYSLQAGQASLALQARPAQTPGYARGVRSVASCTRVLRRLAVRGGRAAEDREEVPPRHLPLPLCFGGGHRHSLPRAPKIREDPVEVNSSGPCACPHLMTEVPLYPGAIICRCRANMAHVR